MQKAYHLGFFVYSSSPLQRFYSKNVVVCFKNTLILAIFATFSTHSYSFFELLGRIWGENFIPAIPHGLLFATAG